MPLTNLNTDELITPADVINRIKDSNIVTSSVLNSASWLSATYGNETVYYYKYSNSNITQNSIIEISYETDVMNDIVGKEEAELDDKDLDEGMRLILHNDKTEKMNNKILNVKYDDKGLLKLVANRGRPKKNS